MSCRASSSFVNIAGKLGCSDDATLATRITGQPLPSTETTRKDAPIATAARYDRTPRSAKFQDALCDKPPALKEGPNHASRPYRTALATILCNARPPLDGVSVAGRLERILDFGGSDLENIGGSFLGDTWMRTEIGRKRLLSRSINTAPTRILDVPGLMDDFYLQLLDWSPHNQVVTALGSQVWYWNATTNQVNSLPRPAEDSVSALAWMPACGGVSGYASTGDGRSTLGGATDFLAVATRSGKLEVHDMAREGRVVAKFGGHGRNRIGALAWNGNVLTSGGRDGRIIHHDLRVAAPSCGPNSRSHQLEVCGLRWNPAGTELASGGNDNQLMIWSGFDGNTPMVRYQEHLAAIKAIAWSPHQRGLLVSGGGTADRTLRFWNTLLGTSSSLKSHDTGAQVCMAQWSPFSAVEVLTTHGYTDHQLSLWHYPSMATIATFHGHKQRVLYTAIAPDGGTVVTGSGDETLRFWSVFERKKRGHPGRLSLENEQNSTYVTR